MTPEYIRERWDWINSLKPIIPITAQLDLEVELYREVCRYLQEKTQDAESRFLLRELVGER